MISLLLVIADEDADRTSGGFSSGELERDDMEALQPTMWLGTEDGWWVLERGGIGNGEGGSHQGSLREMTWRHCSLLCGLEQKMVSVREGRYREWGGGFSSGELERDDMEALQPTVWLGTEDGWWVLRVGYLIKIVIGHLVGSHRVAWKRWFGRHVVRNLG